MNALALRTARFAWSLAWVIVIAPLDSRAQATVEDDDETVVTLPPLLVEERLAPMRWRFLEGPGLEVLSACDDGVTRDFVRRCLRLEQVLQVVLPYRFQARSSVPETQILFNEDLRRAKSQELMAEMLRRENQSRPAVGVPLSPANGGLAQSGGLAPWQRRRVSFLPNFRLSDIDATSVFVAAQDVAGAQLDFTFVVDRIAALLERRVPALPDWFVEGTIGLYAQTRLRPDEIVIEPALWVSEAETRALRDDEDHPRTFWPMQELLARRRPMPGEDAGDMDQIWRAQCALFVRWALVEQDGARREGLWTLVDRLENEPLSEDLFRACLGLGFSDVRDRLSDYLPVAVGKGVTLRVPRPTPPPESKLRAATDIEIARIRGDWERMQINYVKRRFPELTGKYVEQARRTLQNAVEAGARDPRLLAVIGLVECDADNPAGARAYLEAAALGGVQRPRVLVELARQRLEEVLAVAGEESLATDQVAKVMEPLHAARKLAPPLVAAYIIMAELWSRSAEAPSAADLEILREGVAYFPRFSPFVLRVIYLHAVQGLVEPAIGLATVGVRHATEPETRLRFERILAQLDAVRRRP